MAGEFTDDIFQVEMAGEFTDDGTETHFTIGNEPACVRAISSGRNGQYRQNEIVCFLRAINLGCWNLRAINLGFWNLRAIHLGS